MSGFRYYDGFLRDAFLKGKAEAKAEGLAEAVVLVLEARGVVVDGRQRARIEACGDLEQLDVWLVRAALATNADEVFEQG
ncbi:hypothetical protein [Actinomadura sp. WMMB 499]|uniref:hypothetical protein n=1 Tax=Actinomadura sp. WMMB 499 TaxID=1219491 RepID=UPI0012485D0E|nr:hypothetical protein [Actinomadura sp. WMMB 499]QFG23988.1 hypothetical protein F7P10_25550 [Actinomadura sp. WMMB 499]